MSTKEQRRLSVQEAIRARERARHPKPPEPQPPEPPKRKRVTPDQVFASSLPIEAVNVEVRNEIDEIGEGDQ